MQTIGYLFVGLALVIIWSVSRGRVGSLGPDLGHLITSLLRGDYAGVQAVLGAKGEALDPVEGPPHVDFFDASTSNPLFGGSDLVTEMRKLAAEAHGKYTYGGSDVKTGFDCSGLVWRAMYELKIYTGPRFTTDTFHQVAESKGWPMRVIASAGDVVVFPGSGVNGHMGVSTGGGRYYSALSTRSGIKEGPISNHPGTPIYYHIG